MRILFTGASSFTGYWLVRRLVEAGHELVCPIRGDLGHYAGIRQRRVQALNPFCRLVPQAPFGSEAFLNVIRQDNRWDLLCHHAAEVGDYKSAEFDCYRALANNTLNLPAVLAALQSAGARAVVLTGTVFENDEGLGNEPLRAFSPYGLSKGLTWQVFRYACGQAAMPLGKFVVPNPFGPFEEPRFTAYLMRTWREGKTATVKTPDYVRDNLPVDLLSTVYRRFAERVAIGGRAVDRCNPSGYVGRQADFAERVAREVRARTGWPCTLEFARQEDFSEPLMRVNRDPAAPLAPEWNEHAAWDAFVEFYHSIAEAGSLRL